MSETNASTVRLKVKHAMTNWRDMSNREIAACLLLLAEAIEAIDAKQKTPDNTPPAT